MAARHVKGINETVARDRIGSKETYKSCALSWISTVSIHEPLLIVRNFLFLVWDTGLSGR